MIHLPALPGAPLCSMNLQEIRRSVLAHSAALAEHAQAHCEQSRSFEKPPAMRHQSVFDLFRNAVG
jgi:hypothetical protein